MNELITGHYFEIFVLLANLAVAVVNNGLKARVKEVKQDILLAKSANENSISQLKTEMYRSFLTKDDFYSTVRDDKHRGQ